MSQITKRLHVVVMQGIKKCQIGRLLGEVLTYSQRGLAVNRLTGDWGELGMKAVLKIADILIRPAICLVVSY